MMNIKKIIVVRRDSIKGVTATFWRYLFIIYCSLCVVHSSFSQIGTWQSHVSYQSGQSVAVVANKIYVATQNGLFYYDKSTSETTTLGKTTGLSDVGISRLLYLADQKRLLITYRNGNIDFLTVSDTGEPGAVANVNVIVTTANLPASRTINHINRIGSNAYLSTDFGLIVLDVLKNEIRDTYFSLRSDGTPLPIIQTAATSDSLYALTAVVNPKETGRRIRAIRFAASVNIADPANWRPIVEPGLEIESLNANQGRLLATLNNLGVYERQNSRWVLTQSAPAAIVRQFPATTGLILSTDKFVTLPGSGTFTSSLLTDPREVVADGNQIWVADATNGLLAGSAGTFQRIAPEGPTRDLFAQLYTYSQTLVALPAGTRNDTLFAVNQPPVNILSVPNDRWVNSLLPGLIRSFNAAAYLPTEQRLYLGSFGSGLWSQREGQPATSVTLPATISPYITSLATDPAGNLWITTGRAAVQATLHVRRPDGSFQSFPSVNQVNIVQVVPDDYGFLWIRLDLGSGLFVFDPQTDQSRFLSTLAGQGGLLTNNIRTLAKDRNGAIWIGTDLGPMVFDDPASVFDGKTDAQSPLLNRRRLLANEVITAIAVDGGNRKWIGTQKGIYHVAPDGSQLLDTFTAANSPLPNDLIQAVAIEPISGKVFMQTGPADRPNGLVSYQGQATEPTDTLKKLTIFPNPVRPDFTGLVGINGLTDNATVKILDAGGQLVYETRSQGGTATWNLRDYRNRQAQTGIYLVVVVTSDGSESLAGKLAVVR